MADDHIIRDTLGRVGEAGFSDLAVIDVTGPAVGLDADGDVDLRYLQGTADVLHRVVSRIRVVSGNYGILRSYGSGAGIQAANRIRGIGIGIIEFDTRQGMLRQQALHLDLVGNLFCNRQRSSVILFGSADRRDGDLLLVEQGKLQTGCGVFIGDLVTVARGSPFVQGADDGLVQLPSGDGGAGEGKGLADLQALDVRCRARNGVAVHIHKVDRYGGIFEAGVVEVEDVRLRAGSEDQGLLHGIRIELDPVQLVMGGIERFIIHGRSHFDDGGGVAGYIIDRLRFRHFYGVLEGRCRILLRIQDVHHRIAGGIPLRAVHEGDDILAVYRSKGQRLAVRLRTVTSDGDSGFGDHLVNHKVRVGNHFIRSHRIILTIHIVDRIGQCLAAPMGVYGGIRRDLGVPVEEGVPVRGGVPAFEDIACLGGGRLGSGNLLVLLYRLGLIDGCSIIAVHKRDGIGRCIPLGVEHQSYTAIRSTGRHLAEYIRCTFAPSIVIPTREGIITVHSALRLSGRPIVSTAGYGGIVFDVGDRLQLVCAIIILDLIGMPVIIEIVCRICIARMVIRVAFDFFRVVIAAGCCLAVQRGQGVSIIIRILEIIVDLDCIIVVTPITSNRHIRARIG